MTLFKPFLLSLLFASCYLFSSAQIEVEKISKKEVTKGINYKGNFVTAQKWKDDNGMNLFIISNKVVYGNYSSNPVQKKIYASHYLLEPDTFSTVWKLRDYLPCQGTDLTLRYREKYARITDLDSNGIAELWVIYMKKCGGGPGGGVQKIIMHENEKTYALRGTIFSWKGAESGMGPDTGKFKYNDLFAAGPEVFLNYAKKFWADHLYESTR
jgi:hypothetical protein